MHNLCMQFTLSIPQLLDAYAADPLGDGDHLPPAIPKKLAQRLSQVPGAFSLLAW